MEPWTLLSERQVYRNKHWLTVIEQEVRLPNGQVIPDYIVTQVPDVAMIFPVTETGEVLLVEQYRQGIRANALDLPAGYLDAGEDPFDAARRELEEETGHTGGRWTPLGAYYYGESRHNGRFFYYLAEEVVPAGQINWDTTEELEVHRLPVEEVLRATWEGHIRSVPSILGIYRALDMRQGTAPYNITGE
jgi:8-oxo-dGTP pyrophosphatase MutT (NUDIX family)